MEKLLPKIINLPSPNGDRNKPLKMVIFDSWYDIYRGVICTVSVMDGVIKAGDIITSCHTEKSYEVGEVGIFNPNPSLVFALYSGQVGYVIMGMRDRKVCFFFYFVFLFIYLFLFICFYLFVFYFYFLFIYLFLLYFKFLLIFHFIVLYY